MGFRFRKSIGNKNLRLNLSKSGVSISTGLKGARLSVNDKGVIRKTVGIDGIYYQDQHKIIPINNKTKIANINNKQVSTKKIKMFPISIISLGLIGFGFAVIGIGLFSCSIIWNMCVKANMKK